MNPAAIHEKPFALARRFYLRLKLLMFLGADGEQIASCCHEVLRCLFTEMLARRQAEAVADCGICFYYHLLLEYEPGLSVYCREVALVESVYFDSFRNPLGYHKLTLEKVKLCCEKTKLVYETLTGDRTGSRRRNSL